MNHSQRLHALSDCWQNLAEHFATKVAVSACWPHLATYRNRLAGSAVHALLPHVGVLWNDRAAHAPRRGADQERQATNGRVGGQDDPSRQRQGNGCTHPQEANCCGQENKPDHHFVQPPREDWNQDARRAWQEYGPVLVKVRRSVAAFQRLLGELTGAIQGIFERLSGLGSMQPRGESGWDARKLSDNPLKENTFIGGRLGPALRTTRSAATRRAFHRCTAAIWRNHVIRIKAAIREAIWEVNEDCLSFVIPQKQGVAAAAHEDAT